MCNPGFLAKTKKSGTVRHHSPRKTSYVTRVAPQHCPALHMSKRKFMVANNFYVVKVLSSPISP